MGKHHDDDGIIDDDYKENGMQYSEDFDGINENEDCTSEADKDYIDVLDKITDRGENISQLLMGEDWYQDLDDNDDYYTSPLMDLISYSF